MNDSNELLLGVNIDHIATIRQARGTRYPEPLQAALVAEQSGADSITLHLREDRRHIQDRDVEQLRGMLQTRMNLEMAMTAEMLAIARRVKPEDCCLVPEKREELTTEGGLDAAAALPALKDYCAALAEAGIRVSLFIDAEIRQIDAALDAGAPVIEIHTGHYAEVQGVKRAAELTKIQKAAAYALKAGLQVNAGHGLDYHNVRPIATIPGMSELNIGHSIVSRALFVGMGEAVRQMKAAMRGLLV